MKALLMALALFLGASPAFGYRLLDADDVSMEGYQIINNRDPYWHYADPAGAQPGAEHWAQGLAANLNFTLLGLGERDWFRLYYDARVHGESTNNGFRQVGLQYETGLSLDSKVDFYWFHHSQHLLDAEPEGRFPLQNFVGVRVHFYKRAAE